MSSNLWLQAMELFYVDKPTKFISSIEKAKNHDAKIITLDQRKQETKLIGQRKQEHKPYLISFYDGGLWWSAIVLSKRLRIST